MSKEKKRIYLSEKVKVAKICQDDELIFFDNFSQELFSIIGDVRIALDKESKKYSLIKIYLNEHGVEEYVFLRLPQKNSFEEILEVYLNLLREQLIFLELPLRKELL